MIDKDSKLNPELQALLACLLDDTLADEGRQRLCEILRDNPQAQDEYRRLLKLHALLHLDFSEGQLQMLPALIRRQQVSEKVRSHSAPPGEVALSGYGGLRSIVAGVRQTGTACQHYFESSYGRRLVGALAALAASILFV